ncbi:MAG: glycosyltransferase family 1 protein [Parcubacteria group bacterium]|jgi:glycosyltransferase involved in cell wall biosynthesis
MKIGIDIRLIGKNQTGSEVYFFNLVKNLAVIDKDNEYHLFTDRDPASDKQLAGELEKLSLGNNFRVEFVGNKDKFSWNLWQLPMHLKKNPVDVYHTQYITPFWLPRKTKLVTTIHDISFNYFPEFIKKLDLFFLKTFIPRSIRRADRVIAVSEYSRKDIIKYYQAPEEKVASICNGIDFDSYSANFSNQEKEEVKNKYKLPEKFLLYLGTLQPRKNIPALIEAYRILLGKYGHRELKLVIAGDKNAHNFDRKIDDLVGKMELQDDIIFPGWIEEPDKPILYKLADCFVFPSLYEGFGFPILEAMASGTPIVSSNETSLPEIGKNGALFCDPQNYEQFAENIDQVLRDTKARSVLIEKGLAVSQQFSWQTTARKTLEIYLSLNK